MQPALKTNVAASMMNDVPGPTSATMTPPIAGPAKLRAAWRTICSIALACGMSVGVRMSGTSALNAGAKNASPIPCSRTSRTSIQISSEPLIARTPIPSCTAARRRSAPIITRRRSSRSLSTPAMRMNSTSPAVHASPTSASALGLFDSS
jgi:hypothetical protein